MWSEDHIRATKEGATRGANIEGCSRITSGDEEDAVRSQISSSALLLVDDAIGWQMFSSVFK